MFSCNQPHAGEVCSHALSHTQGRCVLMHSVTHGAGAFSCTQPHAGQVCSHALSHTQGRCVLMHSATRGGAYVVHCQGGGHTRACKLAVSCVLAVHTLTCVFAVSCGHAARTRTAAICSHACMHIPFGASGPIQQPVLLTWQCTCEHPLHAYAWGGMQAGSGGVHGAAVSPPNPKPLNLNGCAGCHEVRLSQG